MKKLTTALLTSCFVLGLSCSAWADTASKITFPVNSNKYTVNGQEYAMDSKTFTENGRTYVPFRYLAYSLGASEKDVTFDNTINAAILTLNGKTIVATLGSKMLEDNMSMVQMDVAPLLRNGRVYLPARYIAEGQGYTAQWDSTTQCVQLDKAPLSENQPTVTTKTIKSETDVLTVDVQLPVISGLKNNEFQESLNKQFLDDANQLQATQEKQAKADQSEAASAGYPFRAHSLFINYDTLATKDILVIKKLTSQYTGGAHGSAFQQNFNIDVKNGKLITLKDLFKAGVNYKQIINPEITKQIRVREQNGEQYFFEGDLAFKSIADNQSFYIKGDQVIICFDQYEIAPYASGIPEFAIPLSLLKPYMNEATLDLIQ